MSARIAFSHDANWCLSTGSTLCCYLINLMCAVIYIQFEIFFENKATSFVLIVIPKSFGEIDEIEADAFIEKLQNIGIVIHHIFKVILHKLFPSCCKSLSLQHEAQGAKMMTPMKSNIRSKANKRDQPESASFLYTVGDEN